MRALRVDKMTLAALEATLRLALDPEHAVTEIPLWVFLSATEASLRERAERLAVRLSGAGLHVGVAVTTAFLGGGSLPGEPIPSVAVRVSAPWPGGAASENAWARTLRLGDPAVVARVRDGTVLFDLRGVDPDDDDRLADALTRSATGAA